jgi:hypothetical protein
MGHWYWWWNQYQIQANPSSPIFTILSQESARVYGECVEASGERVRMSRNKGEFGKK